MGLPRFVCKLKDYPDLDETLKKEDAELDAVLSEIDLINARVKKIQERAQVINKRKWTFVQDYLKEKELIKKDHPEFDGSISINPEDNSVYLRDVEEDSLDGLLKKLAKKFGQDHHCEH